MIIVINKREINHNHVDSVYVNTIVSILIHFFVGIQAIHDNFESQNLRLENFRSENLSGSISPRVAKWCPLTMTADLCHFLYFIC